MKIIATLALTFIILGLALATPTQAEEHYIYRNAAGQLVISNKPPPAESEVLRKLELNDGKQPGEDRDAQPENPEAPPKPSRDK
jgi:hypothetical protein